MLSKNKCLFIWLGVALVVVTINIYCDNSSNTLISGLFDKLSSIAVIFSVIFVAVQAHQMQKSYAYNTNKEAIEKAVQLAGYYEEQILPRFTFILSFLTEEQKRIIKNINADAIIFFEESEVRDLLTEQDISKFDLIKFLDSINLGKYALLFNNAPPALKQEFIHPLHSNISKDNTAILSTLLSKDSKENKEKQFKESKEEILFFYKKDFSNQLTKLLNKLEYFSMNFNTGIADEQAVYQSLHQTYLTTISKLYPFLAVKNKGTDHDKYYCNIIELYNLWNKQRTNAINNEKKHKGNALRSCKIEK